MFDKNPLLPDGLDVSWNVVSYSATTLPEDSRVMEMKIPYSMLQLSKNQDVQTSATYYSRRMPKIGQISEWPNIPRNIRTSLVVNYKLNRDKSFGRFQRGDLIFGLSQGLSYLELYNMGMGFNVTPAVTSRSFATVQVGGHVYEIFGDYDLWGACARGVRSKPAASECLAEYGTDSGRRLQIIPGADARFDELRGREYKIYVSCRYNISRRFLLEAKFTGNVDRNKKACASDETFWKINGERQIDNAAAAPEDLSAADYSGIVRNGNQDVISKEGREYTPGSNQYYVPLFGARNISYLELTLRKTLSFGSRFSIQQCTQLFAAKGLCNNSRIPVAPDYLVAFPKRRIFNHKNLRSNRITRWEYQPGSSMYLVWMHSRNRRENMNPLPPGARRRIDKTCQNSFPIFPGYFCKVTSDRKFIMHFIDTMIV